MSAIPTDEPAQEAPPSLDTQQIQQQIQQDSQLNPQPVSTEQNRKRLSSLFTAISVPDLSYSEGTVRSEGLCGLSHWQNKM